MILWKQHLEFATRYSVSLFLNSQVLFPRPTPNELPLIKTKICQITNIVTTLPPFLHSWLLLSRPAKRDEMIILGLCLLYSSVVSSPWASDSVKRFIKEGNRKSVFFFQRFALSKAILVDVLAEATFIRWPLFWGLPLTYMLFQRDKDNQIVCIYQKLYLVVIRYI